MPQPMTTCLMIARSHDASTSSGAHSRPCTREVVEAGAPALAQAGMAPAAQDADALEEQLRSLAPQECLLLLQAVLGAAAACLRHVAAVQQYAARLCRVHAFH